MTPNEIARELVMASKSLIALLNEESEALRQVKLARVTELHDAKEDAAVHYETIMKEAGAHPALLAATGPADRRALIAVKDELDHATAHNINALRAAMEMNRRLVQTIAASIERQRTSAAGYTKTGAAYARAHSPAGGDMMPVSLNETF
jgi:hypothetical protein